MGATPQSALAFAGIPLAEEQKMINDLALMKSVFFSGDPDADLDGNGVVNFADLAILKSLVFLPPGPSANGCN